MEITGWLVGLRPLTLPGQLAGWKNFFLFGARAAGVCAGPARGSVQKI